MIDDAERGDLLAHETLLEAAAQCHHTGQHAQLLTDYHFRRATNPPPRRPGPATLANTSYSVGTLRRNIGYCSIMAILSSCYGLNPSHNDGNDRPCGSWVLSEALRRRHKIHIYPKRLAQSL